MYFFNCGPHRLIKATAAQGHSLKINILDKPWRLILKKNKGPLASQRARPFDIMLSHPVLGSLAGADTAASLV